MKRRTFFSKCAAFVAGCALGVGIQTKAFQDDWQMRLNELEIRAMGAYLPGLYDFLAEMKQQKISSQA